MKVGSLVETVTCFEELRRTWGINYPKRGEILRVRDIQPHSNKSVRDKGIVFLYFEEYPDLVGVCDKKVCGEPNFLEIFPFEVGKEEEFKLTILENKKNYIL